MKSDGRDSDSKFVCEFPIRDCPQVLLQFPGPDHPCLLLKRWDSEGFPFCTDMSATTPGLFADRVFRATEVPFLSTGGAAGIAVNTERCLRSVDATPLHQQRRQETRPESGPALVPVFAGPFVSTEMHTIRMTV